MQVQESERVDNRMGHTQGAPTERFRDSHFVDALFHGVHQRLPLKVEDLKG